MAGDDDDDDDDVNDYVTTAPVTSPMGLPPTVVALLGRMTSYSDRMAWTVVEDACRVCLTLSWDVDERRWRQRRDGRQRSLEAPCDGGGGGSTAPAAGCKESLWSRIRRSLHSRRSVSVDSTTADIRRHQQHPQMTSHCRSRDANDERSYAVRERWRSAVRQQRSVSAGRGPSGTADVSAAAAWKRQRQRSWHNADVVEPSPDAKDLQMPTGATQSKGRLLPSLSLPERFLSPPPLHHHYQLHHHQHQRQQQQLPAHDEFLRVHTPQYDGSANSVSVSSVRHHFCYTVTT